MFDAEPQETTLEAGGHVKGVAPAIVHQNRDDSGLGRVKVTYPWHDKPTDSYWARIAMPMAGGGRGTWFLPEIGDEVLVAFERGDLRFPYVVGSLWNGQDRSPTTNANGNNDLRMIRTRKGHEVVFDDNGQKGRVRIALNDGKTLTIDDDGLRLDDTAGNSLAIDTRQGSLTIVAAVSLTLRAPQITIDGSATTDVTAGTALTLRGGTVMIN